MDKLKNCWKSITVWFNGLVLAVIPFVETIVSAVKENMPELGQYMTPDLLKYVGIAVVILNIALRFKTSQPLEQK